MGERSHAPDVHRLIDIVVEEISLVDHAANKHRFLIVKRSEDMDESTPETPPDAEGTAPEVEGVTEDTNSGPLSVAVAALEGLTEAVELLGSLSTEGNTTRLSALATELEGVSAALMQVAGGVENPPKSNAPPTAPKQEEGPISSVVEAVRATLERVGTLLQQDTSKTSTPPVVTPPVPTPESGLSGQLTELMTAVQALTSTVTAQQQRVAQLEKRTGLPNSAPVGEQPPAPVPDASWPLDLNRPFDRESVDKATSFHDL